MEDFRNRRRNYYIKKEFQRNFIIKFCALVAAGAFMSGAIIYFMSGATVTTTFENSRLTIKSTADYILPAVLLSSAIVIFLIGFATIIVTLFTSHKIAGPLYRMEKDLEEFTSGNLGIRFKLRGGDEIKALAENLDKMAQSVRDKVVRIKEAASALKSETAFSSPEIKKKIDNLNEAISKFNV